VHKGEKPFECPHPGCGQSFANNANMKRHARIHSGVQPYACDTCGRRFNQSSNCKVHEGKCAAGTPRAQKRAQREDVPSPLRPLDSPARPPKKVDAAPDELVPQSRKRPRALLFEDDHSDNEEEDDDEASREEEEEDGEEEQSSDHEYKLKKKKKKHHHRHREHKKARHGDTVPDAPAALGV